MAGRYKLGENAYRRQWHAKHRDADNERSRARHYRWRRELIEAYGGQCVCCGEKQLAFLAIDHSRRDGTEDRKRTGSGGSFVAAVRAAGYPQDRGYRVLCHNCNVATMHGRTCPHEQVGVFLDG